MPSLSRKSQSLGGMFGQAKEMASDAAGKVKETLVGASASVGLGTARLRHSGDGK